MLRFENTSTPNTFAIYVDSIDRDDVLIHWKYKPTHDELSDHRITIYRSEGQTGEPTLLKNISAFNTTFVDTDVNDYDNYRRWYYQLQIDDGELTQRFTTDLNPDNMALAYRKRVKVEMRFDGTPCLAYVRSDSGQRCSACWNVRMQMSDPNCEVCDGTGYETGYFPPVLTLIHIIPPVLVTQAQETLKKLQTTYAFMGHFPLMNPLDFIADLETGLRWRIVKNQPIKAANSVVKQQVELIKVNLTDVEYKIDLPKEDLEPIIIPRKGQYFAKYNTIKEIPNGNE